MSLFFCGFYFFFSGFFSFSVLLKELLNLVFSPRKLTNDINALKSTNIV